MSDTTPNPAEPLQPLSPSDERLWATLIPIGGIIFHFLPALIGYLLLKDRGPFIRENTRSALNFQLSVLIGYVVGFITVFFFIGILVLLAVGVLNIVFCIMAAVAANRGEVYRYPLSFRFIPA